MRLILFGPPGVGKGTYASILKREYQIPHISTGDLVREEIKRKSHLGELFTTFTQKGDLAPDAAIIALLKDRMHQSDCRDGFILDGFPRTVQQAEALENVAKIDLVVNIEIPNTVIIERLSNRLVCKDCGAIYNAKYLKPKKEGVCDICEGYLYRRDDDRPEVIQERLNVYRIQTKPLIEYYTHRRLIVNISPREPSAPPEKVIKEITKVIKKRGVT